MRIHKRLIDLNSPTEVVKQIIINIEAGVEVKIRSDLSSNCVGVLTNIVGRSNDSCIIFLFNLRTTSLSIPLLSWRSSVSRLC